MADYPAFAAEKGRAALQATIGRLVTETGGTGAGLLELGNAWTREHFDGGFWISPERPGLPSVSLVFVQSRTGNTAAENPADLGGGDTDLHLIYEGLSRVAADAVLAGARTATGRVLFSVWRPELVALRETLGLPRHPAQVVVTNEGRLDFDGTLLFNVPNVPVFLLAGRQARDRCARVIAQRPWIRLVPVEELDPASAIRQLAAHGIRRISVVGGRSVASALIDAGVVQDLYLTTSSKDAGEPDTPFYVGRRRLSLQPIVRKRSAPDVEAPILFEHSTISISG
jgi:riboflavin biosynthesis pyrimidine reductase